MSLPYITNRTLRRIWMVLTVPTIMVVATVIVICRAAYEGTVYGFEVFRSDVRDEFDSWEDLPAVLKNSWNSTSKTPPKV